MDGVFEGIRSYRRRVFRLRDHLLRLHASARSIGLELPAELDRIEKIVLETARAFGEADSYLRLVVTRGTGGLGVDPTTCRAPRLFCIAAKVDLFSPERLVSGIELVTVSVRRPALDALDPRVKSLNYLNSVLAKREAKLRGADEGLILNASGRVAEASVANVFAARSGVLRSPPAIDGSLDGITRQSVMTLARAAGIEVREQSLSRSDLLDADELFLTGTGARIVPVAIYDEQPIGSSDLLPGHRPITRAVLDAFPAFAAEHGTPF